MFADFLNRLIQPEPAPLADADARLALTALLIRIARSDNDYSAPEIARIDQITSHRYNLDASQAELLRKRWLAVWMLSFVKA